MLLSTQHPNYRISLTHSYFESVNMKNRHGTLLLLVQTVAMAFIYCLSGMLSLSVFHENALITMSAFFPEGFALAGVLLFGTRILPGILLGQLALAYFSGFPLLTGIGIGISNMLEAYIALKLFHWLKLNTHLHTLRDVFGLMMLIVVVLQPFSAFTGNAILYFSGLLTLAQIPGSLFYWWIGNVLGQILLTPMLLIYYHERSHTKSLYILLIIIITVLMNYFFQITLEIKNLSLLLIITLPATIFLSTRDLLYGSISSVVLASISLYFAHNGIGTFSQTSSMIDNLLDLNYFMASHIILVLLVGVLFKEKEEAIRQLRKMAHYDYLTGLPNRHMLREEIHYAVSMSDQYGYRSAICYLDIDNFKPINDTFGHHTGDEVLKSITERVQKHITARDAFLRIGGDEFLLILNKIDEKKEIGNILENILVTVASPILVDGRTLHVSCSIGVAFCPDHGITIKDLIGSADKAMYQAKASGRNQVCYASAS